MRKHWMTIVRVVITLAALAFLVLTTNPARILADLGAADPRYLGTAFLLFVLSLVVRACRWFVLVRGLDPGVPFARLLRLYFVGQFFSSFLPSGYGGDVVRALELTQNTDASAAVGTVLLDRMTGLLVNFAIGLALLPFVAAALEPWLLGVLVLVSGGGLAAGALVLEGRLLRWLTGWLPAKLSLAGQGPLAKVYAALTGCGRRAVLSAFGISLGFNVLNVVINWLCGRALGIEVGLGYFFVVTPLISVSTLVPSIGGWGVRENVSRALFAPVVGAAERDVGAALGIAIGLITLGAGLVGGMVYGAGLLLDLWRRRRADAEGKGGIPQ